MKFKYYLRGLGIGVIIATLLLTVEFNVSRKNISDDEIIRRAEKLGMVMADQQSGTVAQAKKDEEDSDAKKDENKENSKADEDVKSEKADQDVAGTEPEDKADTEADKNKDKDKDKSDSANKDKAKEEKTDKKSKEESDKKKADDNKEKEDDNASAKEENSKGESKATSTEENVVENVDFAINSGEFSDTVSRNLFENGLVDDAANFNTFMISNGYDLKLQPGNYVIPKGSTYDEIINILTSR